MTPLLATLKKSLKNSPKINRHDFTAFMSRCLVDSHDLKVQIDGLPIPKGRLVIRVLINPYVGTVPSTFQLLYWNIVCIN